MKLSNVLITVLGIAIIIAIIAGLRYCPACFDCLNFSR